MQKIVAGSITAAEKAGQNFVNPHFP